MEKKIIDRQPSVAGQFYPNNPNELSDSITSYFNKAIPKKIDNVAALICPHAGYVFSGIVAATSYNQLDSQKKYKTIFIISSSHQMYFEGASVYNIGNYVTPLGVVTVNTELANKIINDNTCFIDKPEAHKNEHSIEVHLPFLQKKLQFPFTIIPIIIGTQNITTCKKIADALKPYFTPDNLFIISTDFSHYPSYNDAINVDNKTADAIIANNPEILLNVLKKNESLKINNLSTSLCGWTSVLTLLYITENNTKITYSKLHYQNSGDNYYKDKSRVVGYFSIAASWNNQESTTNKPNLFALSQNDKKELLCIARNAITNKIIKNIIPEIDTSNYSSTLKSNCGVFVTLHKNGKLRGCIGRFNPDEPLYKVVQEMAIAAALHDNRFMPVTDKELNEINIEISVLTPLKPIKSKDEIQLGKHGIYIKKGYNSGTFLPQVATETNWTLEEFLGYCSRDKAGIGWDGWKNSELYIYEAIIFNEKEF